MMRAINLFPWMPSLFAALLAGPASPETVTVRSGEHADFTRLVLDLPLSMPAQLTRNGREALVALPRTDLEFDLDEAFARIPQTRLTSIDTGPTPGTLTLRLGCDCGIDSFLHDERMLVIDISDPPSVARQGSRTVALPLLPERARHTNLPASNESLSLTAALARAEGALAQALGRAASQTLLRPSTDAHATMDRAFPTSGNARSAARPDDEATSRAIEVSNQVTLRNPLAPRRVTDRTGTLEEDCVPDRLLNVEAWSDGTAFVSQIGRHRSNLFREFDRPDPAAAAALARLFVHMGFGAEARAVLPLTTLAPRERQVLSAMARIMDGIGLPVTDDPARHATKTQPAFAGQLDCPGAAALWALLQAAEPRAATPIDVGAVRRAFQGLPVHLRRHVAPEVASRLRASGQAEAATGVLNAVLRLTTESSVALDLASAEAALAEGRLDEATPVLAGIVPTHGPEAPQALAALIETRAAAGLPIDARTAALAESRAREYRDRPLGPRLRRAHVLALIGAGRLDAALQEAARFEARGLQVDRAGILGPLWMAVAEAPGDADFLRRALAAVPVPADLPTDPRTAVADRLLRLGLPGEARSWLTDPDGAGNDATARLLRAEAALVLGHAEEAEALLVDAVGREAEDLRVRARSAMALDRGTAGLTELPAREDAQGRALVTARRSGEAASQVLPPSAPDSRATAMDNSGSGAAIAVGGIPPLSPGRMDATIARQEPSIVSGAPQALTASRRGVLARNRALIEESASTRQALDELLDRFPGPAERD